MKQKKYFIRVAIIAICLVTVLSLSSCLSQLNVGGTSELADEFVGYLVKNDFYGAHGLVSSIVDIEDFQYHWEEIKKVAKGAESYTIKQTGWRLSVEDGELSILTAYQVGFDKGGTVLLQIYSHDEGTISGMYYSDVTEFVKTTDAFIPTVNVILLVFSIAVFGFVVWTFVDCMRRKMRLKVLWAIVILLGAVGTLTVGETFGATGMLTPMMVISKVMADPSLLSINIRVVVPVGAVVYLFIRKQFIITPQAPEEPPIEQ